MKNHVDAEVALEVASHEALVRQTYKDGGGVLTWAVGMTNATGHTVERYIGKPQSLQHCMNVYAWALENYADHVRAVFGNLPKHQFAGILSWTWNLGGGALRKATWVKHFKAGRVKEAEASFKTWNKDDGKVIAGLTKRRAAEADLIFRGKWSNVGTMTEYTQVTKAMTPVWASAVKINVAAELTAAFAKPAPVPMDRPKLPDAPVPHPTTTPPPDKGKGPPWPSSQPLS
jgi:GH24 family phage-related lysozyme (muramidase)